MDLQASTCLILLRWQQICNIPPGMPIRSTTIVFSFNDKICYVTFSPGLTPDRYVRITELLETEVLPGRIQAHLQNIAASWDCECEFRSEDENMFEL